MHHFEASDGTGFNHNPDMSGKVDIAGRDAEWFSSDGSYRVSLSGRTLVEFFVHIAPGLDPADKNAIAHALGFPEADPPDGE